MPKVVVGRKMEIIHVGVDEFVSWVAGHGEHSFLIVTIFSLRRNIICCVWEVGSQLRRKKKRYLNQIIERLARGALKFRNPQVVQY